MGVNSISARFLWVLWMLTSVILISSSMGGVAHAKLIRLTTSQSAPVRAAIYAIPGAKGKSIFVAAERIEEIHTPIYANLGPTSHDRGHTGEMKPDPNLGAYVVIIDGVSLSPSEPPTVSITTRVSATSEIELGVTKLAIGSVAGSSETKLVSSDHNLFLDVPKGILTDTYFILMDTITPPGDPPLGHEFLTRSYSIRPSGAITQSLTPLSLRLSYAPASLNGIDFHTISMFHWEESEKRWQDIISEPSIDGTIPGSKPTSHSKAIEQFGTFALMTAPQWRDSFQDTNSLVNRRNLDWLFGDKLGLLDAGLSGSATSVEIKATQPSNQWDKLSYTAEITAGTALTVDVLSGDGKTVLLENVKDGASLANINVSQYPSLRLRVTMSANQADLTSYLDNWAVSWIPAVKTYQIFLPLVSQSHSFLSLSTSLPTEPGLFGSPPRGAFQKQEKNLDDLGCKLPDATLVPWQSPELISNPDIFSVAPKVAVDSENRLHAIWFAGQNHFEDASLFYATKEPGSTAWSTPELITVAGSQGWYPTIAIDPDDTIHIIWYQLKLINLTFKVDVEYMSKPKGGVWSIPLQLSNTGTIRKGPNLDIFADRAGAIHVVWSDHVVGNDEIFYTVKPKGQATWQAPVQISHSPDNSAAPRVAVDSRGVVHVAWYDVALNAEVYYTSKAASSTTWDGPVNVSKSAAASSWPALVVDQKNSVHLIWQESTQTEATQTITLTYNTKLADASWLTETAQALVTSTVETVLAKNVQAPALGVDAIGGLHTAWTNATDSKVYYMTKPDAETRWSTLQTIASTVPFQEPTDNYLTALIPDRQGAIHLLWGDRRSIESFGDVIWYATAQSTTPMPPNHVIVLDEHGQGVSGACIYQNGHLVGVTNLFGIFAPPIMSAGDYFVGVKPIAEQPSQHRNDWAYRTALTSLNIDETGQVTGQVVSTLGRQRLKLQKRPLIYFNLLISLEWNATDDYIQQLVNSIHPASNYLFDISDGQMAFGQVSIRNDGVDWDKADIQILARNDVQPYSYIGGLTDNDPAHKLIIGRHWNGNSGNTGDWDNLKGYRTIVHEFGHYALHLYDSYIGYDYTKNPPTESRSGCTAPITWITDTNPLNWILVSPSPATDATNASIMTYQYASSELSAKSVPGLWSSSSSKYCENTLQWQLNNHESDWETLIRVYRDQQQPERWKFSSPLDTHKVMAGPQPLSEKLEDFTIISTQPPTIPTTDIQLTVLFTDGTPYDKALVALDTQRVHSKNSVVLDEGSPINGQIAIYGATISDTVRVVSLEGNLSAAMKLPAAGQYTLKLQRNSLRSIKAAAEVPVHPYLSLIPGANGSNLTMIMRGVSSNARLRAQVIPPSNLLGKSVELAYSPTENSYGATVGFNTSTVGLGSVHVLGSDPYAQLVSIDSDFSLLKIDTTTTQELFSPDGHVWLHLEPGSLIDPQAYVVLMPTGAVPQPLPPAMMFIGSAYSLRASGSVAALQHPALLTLFYGAGQVGACGSPTTLQIGFWDGNQWHLQAGQLDETHQTVSMPITQLGIYGLFEQGDNSAPTSDVCISNQRHAYLPLISR